MKSTTVLLTTFIGFLSSPLFAQINALTEQGEKVQLFDDGTWRYSFESETNAEPFVMPTPPALGSTLISTPTKCRLQQESSSPNEITDDEAWIEKNELDRKLFNVPNNFRGITGNLPPWVPEQFRGERIVQASYSLEQLFLIYGNNFAEGRYLIVMDAATEEVLYALDFVNYEYSPEFIVEDESFVQQRITWAEIENGILYVSHSHSTYAESSKGLNAYITAIDLDSKKVLWRTKPLVCNSNNFLLLDDVIVTGYGFTAEKDFLYTLDKKSGQVVQTLPLKTGPSYIIRKGEKIFVRTYNTDYVFRIQH